MENKELEALKQLFSYAKSSASLCISQAYEDKKIIKSALTRLEKLEKAIKLLKNFTLTESFGLNLTLEEFNEAWLLDFTEEEFNLLKEVFGNE